MDWQIGRSTFLLVRHGETEWTKERRYQGHTDICLNKKGIQQAKAIARSFRESGIHFLYTSALRRARETGAWISETTGLQSRVDARLNEISFGQWEGKSGDELIKSGDKIYRRWCRGAGVSPPGGETRACFRHRVGQFMKEIFKRHRGQAVAIVAHGGTVKMLIFKALGIPLHSFGCLRVDPASISQLDVYPGLLQLTRLNDTGHLEV